ncbi:MAG TPA: hypothetical protein VL990_12870 [Acidobacteriaceae bacterium]|nr:hypothetical protein [Acidobacteriaceae bacterium]
MKDNRFLFSVAAAAVAGMMLVGGCNKSNSSTATSTNPASAPAQPQASNPPAPPPDQTATPASPGTAPAPSTGAPAPTTAQSAPTPAPPPTIVIPRGQELRVRLDEDLGSKISEPGQSFGATVADDVVVDGETVIPRGAQAEGTVIDAKPLGHFKGGALLELRLERVRTRWGSYPVATSTMERVEQGKGKRTGIFAGGGGAFGALVGGLAGGGKGALIGGLAGAGAGSAGSAMTGNHQIFLPAETLVTFELEHSVHVTQE